MCVRVCVCGCISLSLSLSFLPSLSICVYINTCSEDRTPFRYSAFCSNSAHERERQRESDKARGIARE